MITIIKDKNKIICSRGTYEDQYKALGYRPIDNKETTKKVVSVVKTEEDKVEENKVEENKVEENKVEENNQPKVTEEDKLKEKYGVGRRNSRKKEED